jgi:uncharacterized protein (AIM24 family)
MDESVVFKAVVLSGENKEMSDVSVSWSAEGKAGTIDETGKFIAESPGEAVVIAQAGDISARVRVTVTSRQIAKIEVKPDNKKAPAGSRISVTAVSLTREDRPAAHSTLSVSSPTPRVSLPGASLPLDASGRATLDVTLPSKPGEVKLIFKGDAATRILELEAIPITRIGIHPGPGPYEAGRMVDFDAVGYDDYGNQMTVPATWSLTGEAASLAEDGTESGKVKMNLPAKGIILARYGEITESQPFSVVPAKPSEIKLTPESAALKAGQSVPFTAEAFNTYGYPLSIDIEWNITEEIGRITADGFFQAEKAGKGAVVAEAGKVRAEAQVSVEHAPLAQLSIKLPKTTVTAGETVTLSAAGIDAYDNRFSVEPRWFLSKSIGTIDPREQTFAARFAGVGEIRAVIGSVMDSRKVEVMPAKLVRLELVPSTVDIVAGESIQFNVFGYDDYGNRIDVEPVFSLEKPLGELSGSGKFQAKTAGSTMLIAAIEDLRSKAAVTVKPAVMQKAAVEPSGPVEVVAGKRCQFNAYGYDSFGNIVKSKTEWAVSPDIGDISPQGGFYPEKTGKGTITAKIKQVRTDKILSVRLPIRIAPGPTARIDLKQTATILKAGETRNFSATAYDELGNETGAAISWSVAEPDLGHISETGLFRARKAGKGKIKAVVNGIFALSDVEVLPAEIVFLKIVPDGVRLKAGEETALSAIGEDRFGNFIKPAVAWGLSDPNLGTISPKAVLMAQKKGKGWILATSRNLVDNVPIRVDAGPLTRISVEPGEVSIQAGAEVDFSAEGFDAGGNAVKIKPKWSVEPNLGDIGEKGVCRAKTVGAGYVIASVEGVTQRAKFRVTPGQPAHISVQPAEIVVSAGQSIKTSIEVRDAYENTIKAPSPHLALSERLGLLGAGGIFTAEKKGSGVITVSAGQATAEIPLTVRVGPLHTIDLFPEAAEMSAGEHVTFSAKGYDAWGNSVEIDPEWAAGSGLGIFTQEGAFKALRPGEGFVTVRSGVVSAVSPIMVHPGAVYRIEVNPGETALEAGQSIAYQAVAYDAQGNKTPARFVWTLENEEMGTIDEGGRFAARKSRTGLSSPGRAKSWVEERPGSPRGRFRGSRQSLTRSFCTPAKS